MVQGYFVGMIEQVLVEKALLRSTTVASTSQQQQALAGVVQHRLKAFCWPHRKSSIEKPQPWRIDATRVSNFVAARQMHVVQRRRQIQLLQRLCKSGVTQFDVSLHEANVAWEAVGLGAEDYCGTVARGDDSLVPRDQIAFIAAAMHEVSAVDKNDKLQRVRGHDLLHQGEVCASLRVDPAPFARATADVKDSLARIADQPRATCLRYCVEGGVYHQVTQEVGQSGLRGVADGLKPAPFRLFDLLGQKLGNEQRVDIRPDHEYDGQHKEPSDEPGEDQVVRPTVRGDATSECYVQPRHDCRRVVPAGCRNQSRRSHFQRECRRIGILTTQTTIPATFRNVASYVIAGMRPGANAKPTSHSQHCT
mmetsp:Transcript_92381/g.260976  ORF Transcript_92381/g.260976 Transcript_92381/m.260976 type:complete len:364 (-) Transcript_92381:2-1093(-)